MRKIVFPTDFSDNAFNAPQYAVELFKHLENADLCIMGTRGKANGGKNSFCSNTLAEMKYVQCPVLGIPEKYKFTSPENTFFPTNYLIPYQKRELKIVTEIARDDSEIHLSSNSKFPVESFGQRENQTFNKEQFFDLQFKCHQVDEQDKLEALMNFIEESHIDILQWSILGKLYWNISCWKYLLKK